MILERLFIENYKQLREPIELFPPEGAIGVVGPNGAGKSTLFESILWAFFGSRGGGPRFANESIPWSGGSTKDPTTVEVTLATDGGSFTVRRRLKSGSTSAEALDAQGRTLVGGTADVTRWVEENLLGMDRTAFEATFYARQKELRFFAHDEGISRVRKISRLLGISSVETAQTFLREDRNDLRSEARLLEGRLAEADLDSLQTELEDAGKVCVRLETELEKVSAEYDTAEKELKSAREIRASLESTYREHSRLTADLREAEADGRRAGDRRADAEKDLADLAAAEDELGRLKPRTARLPEVTSELERLEEDRRRSEQRARDRREHLQAQRRLSNIEGEVADELESLDGEEGDALPGFHDLFDLDGPELLSETLAVLERAAGELERAEASHEELRRLAGDHHAYGVAAKEVSEADESYRAAREEVAGLVEALEDLSGGEDLERAERELREQEEKLRELAALHRGKATADESEAKNIDKAREAIDSGAEEHCPTCHREFESGEQAEISDTLRRQAAAIRRRADRETGEATKLAASADETGEKRMRVASNLNRWRELHEAKVRAENRAEGRIETLEKARSGLEEIEGRISGTEVPTEDDLDTARARSDRLREVRDARPQVKSLATEHTKLTGRIAELAEDLEELAGLNYDADAHREKREEKDRLERALGRVEELERRLSTRPEIENALQAARDLGARGGSGGRTFAAGDLRPRLRRVGLRRFRGDRDSRRRKAVEVEGRAGGTRWRVERCRPPHRTCQNRAKTPRRRQEARQREGGRGLAHGRDGRPLHRVLPKPDGAGAAHARGRGVQPRKGLDGRPLRADGVRRQLPRQALRPLRRFLRHRTLLGRRVRCRQPLREGCTLEDRGLQRRQHSRLPRPRRGLRESRRRAA